MEYTIAAIPTTYNGRRYRSRLEARWAAFFDLLKWNVEYEPCDLGTWSPDFAIWGAYSDSPVLVEVKPIDTWHRETARKMADAVYEAGNHVLLVGVQPDRMGNTSCAIGWLGQTGVYEANWTEGLLGSGRDGRPDFVPNSDEFCKEGLIWQTGEDFAPETFSSLWTEAANIVQWIPRGTK